MLCCRKSLLIQRVAGLNHSCTQCPVRHRLTFKDQRIRSNSRVRQLINCNHGAHEPIQTPHVELDAYTDTQFFKIEAIIRPWRLSDVVHELTAAGILGMTQTSVLGAGVQGGTRERYKGTEHGLDNLIEKSKLDVVCFKTQVDTVVKIICDAARTGEIGDGKIFVSPVSEIIRIRTGETGHTAERMQGGMSDQGDASQALDQDDS